MTLYTIGHSNHSAQHFLGLLNQHAITAICDVRSSPRSRLNPQFDQEELRGSLKRSGIEYVFLGGSLGARPADRSCYFNGRALYSRISKTSAFLSSLERVRQGADKFNMALMCAEKDPLTCHRTILVCRYLTDLGVEHILANGTIETHQDALKRLIKQLGVKSDAGIENQTILNSAYDAQGAKICYAEADWLNNRQIETERLI